MTMQTFVVLIIGTAFGWRLGAATVVLYLAQGAMGLPVFAGTPENGIGLAYMVGPTGGYLVGYVAAAALCGSAASAFSKSAWAALKWRFLKAACPAAIAEGASAGAVAAVEARGFDAAAAGGASCGVITTSNSAAASGMETPPGRGRRLLGLVYRRTRVTALTGYCCGATIWVRPMLTAPGTWFENGKTVRPSWSATDSLLSLPFPVRGSRGTL